MRTVHRWQAEWSRVAPVIGCRGLAHLLGLTPIGRGDSIGFRVVVEAPANPL